MVHPSRVPGRAEPDEPLEPANPDEIQVWDAARNCPACGDMLYARRKKGMRVDGCGNCGGLWVGNAEAQKMLRGNTTTGAEFARGAARHARASAVEEGQRLCPICTSQLALNIIAPANVRADVCVEHGTWFDRNELQVVLDGWGFEVEAMPKAPAVNVSTASAIARELTIDQKEADEIADIVAPSCGIIDTEWDVANMAARTILFLIGRR